jgi:hypothetical protein
MNVHSHTCTVTLLNTASPSADSDTEPDHDNFQVFSMKASLRQIKSRLRFFDVVFFACIGWPIHITHGVKKDSEKGSDGR